MGLHKIEKSPSEQSQQLTERRDSSQNGREIFPIFIAGLILISRTYKLKKLSTKTPSGQSANRELNSTDGPQNKRANK